ncbi:MAG: hypothetical protein EP344_17240 [Bacteroidetes bacterium]|nr:MAG: hypothetical protein EP344_17240 [Bacteroidota bacterium]
MKTRFFLLFLLISAFSLAQTPRLVVPIGHTDVVNSVAFSPATGNRLILTGSGDGTAKLWDRSGKEIQTFRGHAAAVLSVAFSPDGNLILTGSADTTARLWDLEGNQLQVFRGHYLEITSVAFSPDGQYVLTGSLDGTARLWDISGRETRVYKPDFGEINTVIFAPDGKSIFTGHWRPEKKSDFGQEPVGGQVYCFDLASGKQVWESGLGASCTKLAFSSDGKYLLSGWYGGVVRLFDPVAGKEVKGFQVARASGKVNTVPPLPVEEESPGALDQSELALAPADPEDGMEVFYDLFGDGSITALSNSPDGKNLLAAGTGWAIAWNWTTGTETALFQADPKEDTKAVAFAPALFEDNTYLLTGGNFGARLYEWKGNSLQHFSGHSTAATALALSTFDDGETLLLGGGDGSVRRWNLPLMKIQKLGSHGDALRSILQQKHPEWIVCEPGPCEDPVVAARFSTADAGALTISEYGTAIQWDNHGQALQTFEEGDRAVTAIALSPPGPDDPAVGKYIAFGKEDNSIEVWDRQKQKRIQRIEKPTRKVNPFAAEIQAPQYVSALAFSTNDGGTYLFSGDMDNQLEVWNRTSGAKVRAFAGKMSKEGELELRKKHLMDPNGFMKTFEEYAAEHSKSGTGHAAAITAVAFSPDGNTCLSGSADHTAILWDRESGAPLHKLSGHTAGIQAAAFSPDGAYVLTASADNTLKYWNSRSGQLVHTFTGHMAVAIAFSPDGRYVGSGSMDNTVKIWDTQTGRELATLVAIDSVDWVVTAPSGLFDASPGSMRMMHYVVGLEVVDLEQLKERYYEPGLLQKLLGFNAGSVRDVSALGDLPLYPNINAAINGSQLLVELTERNGGLGKLSLLINDKEVTEDINTGREKRLQLDLAQYQRYFLPGTNVVKLRAYNRAGWLKSPAIELQYDPPAGQGDAGQSRPLMRRSKPGLYAIIIGTSDYSGDQLDLRFPDHDARAMAQAIQAAGGRLFEERVQLRLLTSDAKSADSLSSKSNISAAFDAFAAQAQATDVLVVYFSGHGLSYGSAENSQFYYLTKDIASDNLKDPEVRNNYTISSEELTHWLTGIPAQKQVMILDACNSGKVVEALDAIGARALNSTQIRALDRMKDRTGMFVLTGSAADKVSFEASQYGQGLLTYSLLQGMSGLALTSDKRVDVMTLFQYARDRVPDLARGISQMQVPVLAFPSNGSSFDIGIVNAGVRIPVAEVKPVFIRNNFQEEESFTDELDLSGALAAYFQQVTARGAQASLIYVDVKEYENAYSIKGRYRIEGDAVILDGRLYKGKERKGEFKVKGRKDDVPGLVQAIVEKVSGML